MYYGYPQCRRVENPLIGTRCKTSLVLYHAIVYVGVISANGNRLLVAWRRSETIRRASVITRSRRPFYITGKQPVV